MHAVHAHRVQEEGEEREEGTVEGKDIEVAGGWVKVEG